MKRKKYRFIFNENINDMSYIYQNVYYCTTISTRMGYIIIRPYSTDSDITVRLGDLLIVEIPKRKNQYDLVVKVYSK